jgi:hypothetical protein
MNAEGLTITGPCMVIEYEPPGLVGHRVQDVGTELVALNNALPVESMPVINGHIESALSRLYRERARCLEAGISAADVERRIGLLATAQGHLNEALGGLAVARQGYADYIRDAGLAGIGSGFKF